jgi:hypothetical protein
MVVAGLTTESGGPSGNGLGPLSITVAGPVGKGRGPVACAGLVPDGSGRGPSGTAAGCLGKGWEFRAPVQILVREFAWFAGAT